MPAARRGVLAAQATSQGDAPKSLLLLATLLAAIACLSLASAPAAHAPWRVVEHRVAVTTVGAFCLLAAAAVFVLTR